MKRGLAAIFATDPLFVSFKRWQYALLGRKREIKFIRIESEGRHIGQAMVLSPLPLQTHRKLHPACKV